MSVDVDVAVVGYGPGGSMLASLLGQAGHRVAVFEKLPAPYGLPRMSTLDGEIARLLQHAADPAEALKDSAPQSHGYLYGADGEVALVQDWDHELCGHPSHLSLHQPNIEAAMHARIAACPSVQVWWGTNVTAIESGEDFVRITAEPSTPDSTTLQTSLTASWVVGMDGASSFVRQALGIEVEVVQKHDDRWILTDFDILDPDVAIPATEIHMDPEQPYYWGPNGARRCRTDVRVMGDAVAEDLLDHALGYEWLESHTGITRDSVEITRRVLYRFRSQYARSFRRGRVFLGGDAAHAMTPYMAQGSCSAMRDSANLAWKLDLVLSGRADAELLDSYETERQTHVIPFVRGSLAVWAMVTEPDPVRAAQRDAAMRAGMSAPPIPPLTTGILHRDDAGAVVAPAGTLSPQGRVRIDGDEDLLDNLVGFGFQLISTDPVDDVLTEAQRSRLADLGVVVRSIGTGPGQIQDLNGTYTGFFRTHRATAYISRPDFYLFGVADGPAALSDLVEDLLDQIPSAATALVA